MGKLAIHFHSIKLNITSASKKMFPEKGRRWTAQSNRKDFVDKSVYYRGYVGEEKYSPIRSSKPSIWKRQYISRHIEMFLVFLNRFFAPFMWENCSAVREIGRNVSFPPNHNYWVIAFHVGPTRVGPMWRAGWECFQRLVNLLEHAAKDV